MKCFDNHMSCQFETSFLERGHICVNSHMNIHTTEFRELNKYKTTQ